MNFQTQVSGSSMDMAFEHQPTIIRSRQPRPDPLRSIIVKLLAFAVGCLIALAFGLYDIDASTSPQARTPQTQNAPTLSAESV